MKAPKALLFDLDGVLLDTEPLHGMAWSKTAQFAGGKLSNSNLLQLRGRKREDCGKQVLLWIKSNLSIDELLKIHKPIAREILQNAKEMPGAQDLVEWCYRKKINMALVTSSSENSFEYKSASHQWLKLIKTKVLGDDPDLIQGKPYPDPFLLASKKLNLEPNSCWAIEDSIAGKQSAQQAGCRVWILNSLLGNKNENFKFLEENIIEVYKLKSIHEKLKEIYEAGL